MALDEGRTAAGEVAAADRTMVPVLVGGRSDSTPATNSIGCQGDENDSLTVLLLDMVFSGLGLGVAAARFMVSNERTRRQT